MAIKSSDQISIVDVTDAYSVILTSEAYTFPGSTNAAKAGSCTTQVLAFQGDDQVACSVAAAEITKPTGITASVDTNATAPTITITASTSFTAAADVVIPVHITGTDVVINKKFSLSIAFTGATGKGIKSTAVAYQVGTSGTSAPTSTWSNTPVATTAQGQYLWTRTIITYTDNTTTTTYSVAAHGTKGDTGGTGPTGKGIRSTAVTYQVGTSGTTAPTGTWSSNPVATTSPGQFLWTRTIITYTDNATTTTYAVAAHGATGAKGDPGATGAPGADAITLSITSSNGLIFKNTAIATTLTAHVYKAGAEVTGSALTALGTIRWYKDGGSTAVATGQTLTIDAGDVEGKATYIAQLES